MTNLTVNVSAGQSHVPPGVSALDAQRLPVFTETLSWTQRHPRTVAAVGLALVAASGLTGLAAALGGGL